ncbi:MAG: translation initiation factor IF-2 [Chloroflexi bacterium]|nr:translation initiation factor IF-2 [Chloroflexota bacterium]
MRAVARRSGQQRRPARPAVRRSAPSRAATLLQEASPTPPVQVVDKIDLPHALTVAQLAERLGHSPIDVIKALIKEGIMATINQVVDFEVASKVALGFGMQAQVEAKSTAAVHPRLAFEEGGRAHPRPPVVTIMGHVDHGKTTLLDAIRQSDVAATEAGGITQHIGAYQVEVNGQKITFLDTPGHEAFTAMRARGARVTDIAILVVAADDGVMPQTVEAIDHARAAGVPIVVALNKVDKPEANSERAKTQLGEHGLLLEEWGGDVICVPVSAKQKLGLEDLLENILVVAEVAELRADPSRPAQGTVIEASLDPARGTVATVLVQNGTLKTADVVVAGDTWGRVKAMFDDRGRRLRRAEPSTPVEVLGLNQVPQAGDVFEVATEERIARQLIEKRHAERLAAAPHASSLRDIYAQASLGQAKELSVILKADVQGSIEPIRDSLERLATDKLQVRVIHSATGNISESDVMLAVASSGIILGFNTRVEAGARRLAEAEGVDIRLYDVIHSLVDDVSKALQGLLEPVSVEVVLGHGEVRAVFSLGRSAKVAGVFVSDGRLQRGARVRVLRQGQLLRETAIASLRRIKEDAREVAAGFECGVGLEGFADFEEGDVLEAFVVEKR